jgi:hypothetical protein
MNKIIRIALGLSALLYSVPTLAQTQPFAYPAKGQSSEQQNQDHQACYSWAKEQTGVDPSQLSHSTLQASQPSSPQGGALRGAAGGAALGAVGGAIAGNAGEGAAIGAGVGALTGLFRRARREEEAREANAQVSAEEQAQLQRYYQAWTACMEGRGYTVN